MPRPAGYHWHVAEPVVRADGRKPCRWCYGPVEPPKQSWCGNPICIWEWKRRKDWGLTRAAVYDRDRGVCRACGRNTAADVVQMIEVAKAGWLARGLPDVDIMVGHTWEADHIIPVAEGGDWFDLGNLQTLCIGCHLLKTSAQAARRRAARAAAGAV
jgi:5-methylcytosine-specific restriction endonuclease McrA